jgi:hypothetical protein
MFCKESGAEKGGGVSNGATKTVREPIFITRIRPI